MQGVGILLGIPANPTCRSVGLRPWLAAGGQQPHSHRHRDPSIDGPPGLARHEAPRQDADALQEPDEAHGDQDDAKRASDALRERVAALKLASSRLGKTPAIYCPPL